jgi:hypothetical protein
MSKKKISKKAVGKEEEVNFPENVAGKTTVHNRKNVSKDHAAFKGAIAKGGKKHVGGLTKPAIAAKKPVNHKKTSHKRVAGK